MKSSSSRPSKANTSVLFRRSSFFVDVFNVLLNIDSFIFYELSYRMNESPLIKSLFSKSIPKYNNPLREEISPLALSNILGEKVNQNIILDLIDEDAYEESNSNQFIEEFAAYLYMDCIVNPKSGEVPQPTKFGNAMRILSNDKNASRFALYAPFKSKIVQEAISVLFSGTNCPNLEYVYGTEVNEYLRKNMFDNYAFENITSVKNLVEKKHIPRAEVVVPEYNFNVTFHSVGDSIYRRMNLKYDSEYYENLGLNIASIKLPI